jgi:hypothetical protein
MSSCKAAWKEDHARSHKALSQSHKSLSLVVHDYAQADISLRRRAARTFAGHFHPATPHLAHHWYEVLRRRDPVHDSVAHGALPPSSSRLLQVRAPKAHPQGIVGLLSGQHAASAAVAEREPLLAQRQLLERHGGCPRIGDGHTHELRAGQPDMRAQSCESHDKRAASHELPGSHTSASANLCVMATPVTLQTLC